ncbi:MAG: RNA 2',3'-cyclic phosphodiesterase [Chloroflexota bacterium]|nr:RNA 2',3'-cyclic phosphodiesterase [Chloroflexota bacterium]
MQREPGADHLSPRVQRLFIALQTNEAVQHAVAEVQQTLRRRGGSPQVGMPVRWVAPTQVHLTLQFLGNVVSTHIPTLIAALAPAVATHDALLLRADAVGAFPSADAPRVLWLGLRGADDRLRALRGAVTEVVWTAEGVVADRKPFQPHLTIGRVERLYRDAPGIASLRAALRRPVIAPPAAWPVETVALIRSVLGAGGSRYTVLERFPLRNIGTESRHDEGDSHSP